MAGKDSNDFGGHFGRLTDNRQATKYEASTEDRFLASKWGVIIGVVLFLIILVC